MSKRMQLDTGFSDHEVGILNMVFLLFLGIGFEINGHIGDRYKPKQFLLGGMLFTSIAVFLIFLFRAIGITAVTPFVFLQALNGFAESACFPSFVRILGNWYSENNRAIVMTLWSGSKNLGDVIGTIFGSIMIKWLGFSWNFSLFIFGGICLTALYFIKQKLSNSPAEIGLEINKRQRQNALVQEGQEQIDIDQKSKEFTLQEKQGAAAAAAESSQPGSENQQKIVIDDLEEPEQISDANIAGSVPQEKQLKTITIGQAFLIPGVPFFLLGYMCLKSLNYGLIFWLPKYMQDNNLDQISDSVQILWSFGVLLGGFLGGYLSDRFKFKALLMPPSLLFLILSLFAFGSIPLEEKKASMFYLLSFIMGVFQGQPQNLISGPILVDLGKHPRLRGQAQAVGTVTGLIEGAGSLCAALVQIVIPTIGEKNIFILFILMALASFISLLPVAVQEHLHNQKAKKLILKQNNLQQPLNQNDPPIQIEQNNAINLSVKSQRVSELPAPYPSSIVEPKQTYNPQVQAKVIFPSIFPSNTSEKGLLGDFEQPGAIQQLSEEYPKDQAEQPKQNFSSPIQADPNDIFVNSNNLEHLQQLSKATSKQGLLENKEYSYQA